MRKKGLFVHFLSGFRELNEVDFLEDLRVILGIEEKRECNILYAYVFRCTGKNVLNRDSWDYGIDMIVFIIIQSR
jgi:hypothetical protein